MREWLRRSGVLVPALVPVLGLTIMAGAQGDQAQTVIAAMREAMGGDAKISGLKSLSGEGTFRRTFGEREMSGELEWYFVLPDKFQRVEQMQAPTGMPGPRITMTLDGTTGWTDVQGGSGPGFQMRMAGPGGPGGGPGGPGGPPPPGGGPEGRRPDPATMIRMEYYRVLMGVLPVAPGVTGLTFTHGGQAEANEGTADILDVKGENNFKARVFVDTKTHLPLMLTYTAPQPRMRTFERRREGETPEQIRKRFEEERAKLDSQPPQMIESSIFFADHKKVDGVLLPHRLTRSVDGKTTEEIEIKKYKVNPTIDPQQFVKKGS